MLNRGSESEKNTYSMMIYIYNTSELSQVAVEDLKCGWRDQGTEIFCLNLTDAESNLKF